MRYFIINDRKDRSVAIVCHNYLAAHYICRSRSEAFTRAFYGVVRKGSFGKLITKKDKVIVSSFNVSYPNWMESVLKEVAGNYWKIFLKGEIEDETEVGRLVKEHFV